MSVVERLQAVRDRISAAAGDPGAVTLVGVTKGFGADTVRAAIAAGLEDIGESYAQEFVAKARDLERAAPGAAAPRWHFIGRLQRNKVKSIAPLVSLWQSVDRPELGREIAKRAPGATVLVQVDATAEPAKGGCEPGRVPELVEKLRDDGLDVVGLMAMGHLTSADRTEEAFVSTVELADRLELPVRSLGMSNDLEVAVKAGSTMVRIGTALFGPRPEPREVEH